MSKILKYLGGGENEFPSWFDSTSYSNLYGYGNSSSPNYKWLEKNVPTLKRDSSGNLLAPTSAEGAKYGKTREGEYYVSIPANGLRYAFKYTPESNKEVIDKYYDLYLNLNRPLTLSITPSVNTSVADNVNQELNNVPNISIRDSVKKNELESGLQLAKRNYNLKNTAYFNFGDIFKIPLNGAVDVMGMGIDKGLDALTWVGTETNPAFRYLTPELKELARQNAKELFSKATTAISPSLWGESFRSLANGEGWKWTWDPNNEGLFGQDNRWANFAFDALALGGLGKGYKAYKNYKNSSKGILLNKGKSVSPKGIIDELPEETYKYNEVTGNFDVTAPKETWIRKGEELVKKYYESNAEYQRLINSGATPEEAATIMGVRWVNASEAAPGEFVKLGDNIYGQNENINGISHPLYNNSNTAKASLNNANTALSTVFHELGGHGATLNFRLGTQTIPADFAPILEKIYKHNEALHPELKPAYKALKEGNIETAKKLMTPEEFGDLLKTPNGEIDIKAILDLIKYMEDVQEYSARASGTNMSNHYKLPQGWNEQQLRKYFTPESVDRLIKNVWGIGLPVGVGYTMYNMFNPESKKKGGMIHIKKENRGKFTDYCGGTVTSECIARGKRSSNPAIRKRATFAANARKWKHSKGGAFVEGVNVLDSTPSLYKYIKKKIKMAEAGTKFDWNGLARIGVNAAADIWKNNKANKAISLLMKANEKIAKAQDALARLNAKAGASSYVDLYRRMLNNDFANGGNEQFSDIVGSYMQNNIAELLALDQINANKQNLAMQNAELLQLKQNNTSDMISNVANQGVNFLTNYLANKYGNNSSTKFEPITQEFNAPTAKLTYDMYKPNNSLSFDISNPSASKFKFNV